jgi:two-component sensor histidine kinase
MPPITHAIVLLRNNRYFPINPCNHTERKEHECRTDAERYSQFENIGKRQLCIPARQVPDQSHAQDTVARSDAGNQSENKDTEDGGGHRLVVSLVEQLNGTIELDRTTGTAFKIVVKEKQ